MQNNYNNFNCYLLLFVVRYKKMRAKLIGFPAFFHSSSAESSHYAMGRFAPQNLFLL